VRKLINYGRQLGAALLERTADLAAVTCAFGTKDIALILGRIRCGLQRANALEARIIGSASRLDAAPGRAARIAARSPRASAAPRSPAPLAERPDPRLSRLPSAEEIADEVRRRPIGAVIADICRDLGILPSHPLWREISSLIMRHGGSPAALFRDIMDRVVPLPGLDPLRASPRSLAPAGTGPP
jgi:hypothetical protein